MVTSTKFASLVGSVTLAFVLASSLHPVHTAPVAVRRQDVAKAPAGYVSVAQPGMSEQDIYAMGIPDAPSATNAATPAGYVSVAQPSMNEQDVYSVGIPKAPTTTNGTGNPLEQVLKAAAQAALKTSNSTMNVVNHYDATPAVAAAANPAQQVSQVAQPASAEVAMKGNPDEGALFQQVNGVTPEPASVAMQGNPDQGNAYNQIVAQQMAQFGAQARRALGERVEAAVMRARQLSGAGGLGAELKKMEESVLGDGVPTPSSATMVASADAAEVTGAAATAASATTATTADTGAVSATASDLAGIPVAAPVPSDFSSPPAPSPSSNLAVPGVPSIPAVPAVPSVSNPVGSVVPTPALPTSGLPTSALPTSVPSDVPSAAVPSASVPAAVPSVSAPTVPAVPSAPAVPSVSPPSLNAAAASATTLLPLSDANPAPSTKAAGDLTMTVTVPTKALPTSIAGLPNVKPNNANADDDGGDWKTMTILVPAEAFGGIATGVKTQINLPATSSSEAATGATSTSAVVSDKNEAVSSTTAASVKPTPTSDPPINISSFTSLKPAATSQPVLTIPLTGVIGGTTYSTMLTLTIPRFGGEAIASSTSSSAISTSSVSVSATEKANSAVPTSAIPTKTSSSSTPSVKPTSSSSVDDDPSYINPNDIPPLLKSSLTASSTSAPNSTPTNGTTTDEEDCEEYQDDSTDQNQSNSRSLLTKVWDWVTGKPLNERDFMDDYEYGYEAEGEEVWYDAQQE
ncbi:uncharacterized protein UTRI_06505_B [Ustilago trichophora]|uniref:Uncharacterized protein n=1 Tax=Ustilago trichophora TaxID=86804 RepID=A0A5C3EMQ1_9BASI|nr:uncharacterized protein UTRI_06505_B [Ustilago trichophora]